MYSLAQCIYFTNISFYIYNSFKYHVSVSMLLQVKFRIYFVGDTICVYQSEYEHEYKQPSLED